MKSMSIADQMKLEIDEEQKKLKEIEDGKLGGFSWTPGKKAKINPFSHGQKMAPIAMEETKEEINEEKKEEINEEKKEEINEEKKEETKNETKEETKNEIIKLEEKTEEKKKKTKENDFGMGSSSSDDSSGDSSGDSSDDSD